MSIRDEMMSGRLYDATSKELLGELYRAQEMCQDYNALRITDFEGRERLLRRLIGKAGENLVVNPPKSATTARTSRWATTSSSTPTASSWTRRR